MGYSWIGLIRHQDKLFYTIFGSKPSYTNWGPGEPNNAGGSENCGHLVNDHGQWNDIPCGRLFPFICQKQKCKLIFIFTSTFAFIRNGNLIILEVLRFAYFFMATTNMINRMTQITYNFINIHFYFNVCLHKKWEFNSHFISIFFLNACLVTIRDICLCLE